MRYYIDVMDHDDGDKSFHVCDGGQTVAVVNEDLFDDAPSARATATTVRDALNEYSDRRNGKLSANAITSYTQIEAIHEAMRELEAEREFVDIPTYINAVGGMQATIFHKVDVDRCLAKIRAAFAGEKASDDGSP